MHHGRPKPGEDVRLTQPPRGDATLPALVVDEGGQTRRIDVYSEEGFRLLTDLWIRSGWHHRISYEPTWLGIPVIQLPEDIVMMQELIFRIRPDVIVETGTAHGGTAVFYASICELLGRGRVISVDVEIRKYNRLAIQAHPMSARITLIEGSSVDETTVAQVRRCIAPREAVLVVLDSNHAREHVQLELESYAALVSPGGYIVVFDTVLEMLGDAPGLRPEWRDGSPADAVRAFVGRHKEFEVDHYYTRMGATYCRGGFLRRKDD